VESVARRRGGPGSLCARRSGRGAEGRRHPARLAAGQPGQHVDPRGGDRGRRTPDDGRLQQPRHLRSAHRAEQPRHDPPRSRHELVVERGGNRADLRAARRRQVARRRAVHRGRRQMHLGPVNREIGRAPARQSQEGLVQQPGRGEDTRRGPGDLRPQAAAARVYRAACERNVAGLPMPRLAGADASAPDRHRPVQVRRVQA
jgi:hypothetical protein